MILLSSYLCSFWLHGKDNESDPGKKIIHLLFLDNLWSGCLEPDRYPNTAEVKIRSSGFNKDGHLAGLSSSVSTARRNQTRRRLTASIFPSSLNDLLHILLQQLGFFINQKVFCYSFIYENYLIFFYKKNTKANLIKNPGIKKLHAHI